MLSSTEVLAANPHLALAGFFVSGTCAWSVAVFCWLKASYLDYRVVVGGSADNPSCGAVSRFGFSTGALQQHLFHLKPSVLPQTITNQPHPSPATLSDLYLNRSCSAYCDVPLEQPTGRAAHSNYNPPAFSGFFSGFLASSATYVELNGLMVQGSLNPLD